MVSVRRVLVASALVIQSVSGAALVSGHKRQSDTISPLNGTLYANGTLQSKNTTVQPQPGVDVGADAQQVEILVSEGLMSTLTRLTTVTLQPSTTIVDPSSNISPWPSSVLFDPEVAVVAAIPTSAAAVRDTKLSTVYLPTTIYVTASCAGASSVPSALPSAEFIIPPNFISSVLFNANQSQQIQASARNITKNLIITTNGTTEQDLAGFNATSASSNIASPVLTMFVTQTVHMTTIVESTTTTSTTMTFII